METNTLTQEERRQLLSLARQAIEMVVCHGQPLSVDVEHLPDRLQENGVCFVTLTTSDGKLRGCIGGLEATQPLAMDVCQHAAAAALDDYRFQPVRPEEIPSLRIEISRLTLPEQLVYEDPADLPDRLFPNQDGVVLMDGPRRATFLPQVWEKVPDPCEFLTLLCQKMGGPGNLWQHKKLVVEVYRVEEFAE